MTERERRRRRSRSDSRSRSRNEKRSSRDAANRQSTSVVVDLLRFSGSSESNSGSDSSESRSRSRSRERTPPKKRRERERSLSRSSEDTYVSRLTKWEARERQKAKQYEREERREKDRRRDILKEAKKLKHFLEDYDDEKDDPKYYKSSSLFQRRRDFEREREADSKDRLKEQQEIEELRKQILAENKDVQDVDEEARRKQRCVVSGKIAVVQIRINHLVREMEMMIVRVVVQIVMMKMTTTQLTRNQLVMMKKIRQTQKSDAPPSTITQEDRWRSGKFKRVVSHLTLQPSVLPMLYNC
ncbi:hypothetical protein KIN20_001197 [Parelaphostrongylus tenuis]|uniref:Uncharacterized protein n=1 Tax=Parelaphostrongylus tenuis TaxID=148309 RepID=A0AAD5LWN3_PARTN|nr:hypothetical protein KIN20_001197 [Parelaphostrongylus tenuis]